MKHFWPALAGIAVGTTIALCSLLFDKAPSIDRDAWLVLQCGEPVLVAFVHPNGKIEPYSISSLEDLKPLGPRVKASEHQYLITITRGCDVRPQTV